MIHDSTVLVTGASGYIGSSVVKTLSPDRVLATTRSPTPQLASDLGVPVLELDVLNAEDFETSTPISTIIHCATANDILSADFASGVELSVHGTWQMLKLAKQLGVSHFVFLSTFQVYGTELTGQITEQTPVCCETPYGLNHFMGEETCRMFSRVHGLRVSIMRPANIFGVPVASTVNRMSLVPMCFVRDALKEGRLVLKSSGLQRRNFISVSKVAEACVQASLQPDPDLFAIYNVCSAWEVSIREIADMTCEVYLEIFGKALPIEVKSELPSSSTGFTATSRLSGNQIGVNEMRASMKSTIASLFNLMSQ